jgi:hypothetical protein
VGSASSYVSKPDGYDGDARGYAVRASRSAVTEYDEMEKNGHQDPKPRMFSHGGEVIRGRDGIMWAYAVNK